MKRKRSRRIVLPRAATDPYSTRGLSKKLPEVLKRLPLKPPGHKDFSWKERTG